jgi:hypothetical protein
MRGAGMDVPQIEIGLHVHLLSKANGCPSPTRSHSPVSLALKPPSR